MASKRKSVSSSKDEFEDNGVLSEIDDDIDGNDNDDGSADELDKPARRVSSKAKSKAAPKAKAKAKAESKPRAKSVKGDGNDKAAPKRASKKSSKEGNGDESGSDEEEFKVTTQQKLRERQKTPTPPNGDGTRAFYETLLDEFPHCPMAVKYCVEHGVHSGSKLNFYEALYDIYKEKGFGKMSGNDHGFVVAELEKMIHSRMKQNMKMESKVEKIKTE